VAGAAAARRPGLRAAWPAWTAAALLLGFFGAFAVSGQAKANWFVPGLALLVPPAAANLETGRGRTALRGAVGASLLLTAGVTAALLLPHRPDLWSRLTAGAWIDPVAGLYAAHVGGREARVSSTRSWTERAEEFRQRPGDDPRAAGADILAGPDYGLAFRIAHSAGRHARVVLPWDPVFARSCGSELEDGADVLFVSRGQEPPAAWTAGFRSVEELAAPRGRATDESLRVWSCRSWNGGPSGDGAPPRSGGEPVSTR